jgi:MFS family permease
MNTRTQTIPSGMMSSSMPNSDDLRFHHGSREKSSNSSIPSLATHRPSQKTRVFLHERVFTGRLLSSSWCDRFLKDLNWLNLGLCISYGLSTAAATVPIILIPTIAMDILQKSIMVDNDDISENANIDSLISVFASKVTMYAVLGTAFGKFINGPLGDIFGARRVACFYALLVSMSLMVLSFSGGEWTVIYCCVAVEYYQSVQWPCAAIILAAHYGKDDTDGSDKQSSISSEKGHGVQSMPEHVVGDYEKGIYIVSMGSRIGSLLASISVTILLRYQNDSWRFVARLAAMVRKHTKNSIIMYYSFCFNLSLTFYIFSNKGSLLSCFIYYFLLTDSPGKLHEPQNPMKVSFTDIARRNFNYRLNRRFSSQGVFALVFEKLTILAYLGFNVFRYNILPSMKNVLTNATFWVVALAHSGGLMVNSSVRILGTYFRDTSFGTISGNLSGFINLSLSVGVLVGLAIGGNAFANLSNNARARKKMVANLYIMTVAMCYTLSFLAIPFVRRALHSVTLVAILQMIASFLMGAGVAVQVYCIPAIVGCTFGNNKGIYAAYTDGVACIISSWVWSVVGGAVEEGNPQGSGWVYGWAGIALLVVLAGLLMVAFVEHYFCRGGWIHRLRAETTDTIDSNGTMHSMNSFKDIPIQPMTTPERIRKRLWNSRQTLFRSPEPIHRGPEVQSILSIGEDDDDDDTSTIVFEDINSPIDYSDIENIREPVLDPIEVKQRIRRILKYAGNELCCDCHAPDPRWISIIIPNKIGLNHRGASSPLPYRIGCFVCEDCAASHRKLGTQLVLVRSLDHDAFEHEDLVALKQGGNTEVNRIYEANLNHASAKPPPASLSSQRDLFIKTKYEKKMWYKFESSVGPAPGISVESNSSNSKSVFDIVAPCDAKTKDDYERFVRNEREADSEVSLNRIYLSNDDASFSSDDSDNWQIQMSTNKNVVREGLEDLMDL